MQPARFSRSATRTCVQVQVEKWRRHEFPQSRAVGVRPIAIPRLERAATKSKSQDGLRTYSMRMVLLR